MGVRSKVLLSGLLAMAIAGVSLRLMAQRVEVWIAPEPPAGVGRTPLTLPLGRNHFVMSLAADLQGNLWLGTEGEGVFRYTPGKPEGQQWLQFVPKDGLGDEYGYALACDRRGRIWVGHVNHGVSVFNGEAWQNYEPVAGLSRKGSRAGPLGEHVMALAVSPVDGDVWMATNAGLARYSDTKDSWTYYTRGDGLASDQASSLAFDTDGTLYVGMQCDGISMASPADDYKKWNNVGGPDTMPHVPVGKGLPTNEINKLYVARDHTVYAGTPYGLAWSVDKGANWQFIRGKDWIEKELKRLGGPPAGWVPPRDDGGAFLSEDFTTAIMEDPDGNILVGHQGKPGDLVTPRAGRKIAATEDIAVTSLVPIPGSKNMYAGTNGHGLAIETIDKAGATKGPAVPRPAVAGITPPMPAGALPRIPRAIAPEAANAAAKKMPVQFIGEDWMTQGDWVGRYGRQLGVHCAANSPSDTLYNSPSARGIAFTKATNPAMAGNLRLWLDGLSSDSPSSLWSGSEGVRRESQWNDHGEAGQNIVEGPDLWLTVTVPPGTFRISLYFYPFRGHSHNVDREYRDMYVRVGEDAEPFVESAHTRVTNFQGGVYKQFLVEGDKKYRFVIERRYSYNAIINGLFIDQLAGGTTEWSAGALSHMGDERAAPAAMPSLDQLPVDLREIVPAGTFSNARPPTLVTLDRAASVLRYRAAQDTDAPEAILASLRWSTPLWTTKDRNDWNTSVAKGFEWYLAANPAVAERIRNRRP